MSDEPKTLAEHMAKARAARKKENFKRPVEVVRKGAEVRWANYRAKKESSQHVAVKTEAK